MPIDLAQGRVLAFTVAGRAFALACRPTTAKDWTQYFAGIVSTSVTKANGDQESSFDSKGARLALLDSVLVDATGYTADGLSIESIDNWRSKLPIAHRVAAADMLVDVTRTPGDAAMVDALPILGVETVSLDALWSAGSTDEGTPMMQRVSGLTHMFDSPTADHQKRYSRAQSRSVVIGGSRTGETRWLGSQDVMIAIYDELITQASGYVYNGQPLTGRDQIALFMDSYHKVTAISALFAPIEVDAQ